MIYYKHRANHINDPLMYSGLEVDIYANNGNIVVGHDPLENSFLLFKEYLRRCNKDTELAINVKQSGLCDEIIKLMKKVKIKSWFCFDMAVPDFIEYKTKIPKHTAFRFSEYENSYFPECSWLWLDHFEWSESYKNYYQVANEYNVVFVSPELHGRNEALDYHIITYFYGLCTDHC